MDAEQRQQIQRVPGDGDAGRRQRLADQDAVFHLRVTIAFFLAATLALASENARGQTEPDEEMSDPGYSWCKAPRYAGEVVEVGALARQVVDGHPLVHSLVCAGGGNVRNRVIARLLELARVIPVMEQLVQAIALGESFCNHGALPEEAHGVGLVEAARGSLGHWVRIRHGRILNYQIVAPTTWNFSPRDHLGIPGVLEQALLDTEVGVDDADAGAIQHIVRSFDPCMVCTVH